jgi:integrase
MAQGKQAKVLTDAQITTTFKIVAQLPRGEQKAVICALSIRAGLRAKEIACLRWSMVMDSSGRIADAIALTNDASKGRRGGRTIPMHPQLRSALTTLYGAGKAPGEHVVLDRSGQPFRANAVALFFKRLYAGLGYQGCSSHSGRRTFGTALGRRTDPRNVQVLLGHASLADTMRYIEPAEELMRNAVMSL